MPTPEQQSPRQPEAPAGPSPAETLDGMDDLPEQAEKRYKTVAVRVEEQLHAQLQFIAQLSGSSISEEIRTAIQSRIDAAHDDPELIERAQQAREEIEREAAARTAAIAGFMGTAALKGDPAPKPTSGRSRRAGTAGTAGA